MRVPRAVLDQYFAKKQPTITVLVPSYAEEPEVIRKTMLSAALQEYPGLRIVLLVDDSPYPTDPSVRKRLDATRSIGQEIMQLLEGPYQRLSKAFQRFEQTQPKSDFVTAHVVKDLSSHYRWAAEWLLSQADDEVIDDHVDVFFAQQVLRELAHELQLVDQALTASLEEGALPSYDRVHQLYRRLAWIFEAELEVFERKKFASLSHEANKAMNLNSYIGLMGGSYQIKETPDGPVLLPTGRKGRGVLSVPDSDYLLTLDADSILLREYCLRLVYLLEQPDNAKVAVTQTPYSSFRGAATRIERLAGATTDIQHILHQGMSHYNATFWVGANAVIRKQALDDIVETEWIGGFEVSRYIQDRTIIEDTESSVDLAVHGWRLLNYPERLSYSATPPDFGSLIVQRRKWANGGLLILPKLLAQVQERRRRNEHVSRMELFIRLNYMASIAWSSFGLVFLLAYPYDGRLLSPLVLLAAMPYFLAMASDLRKCGYNRSDIFRIYGFNLTLLPVNLAGVLKSIQQALSGKKIPFARTPKVKDRTVSPIVYVIAPMLIVAYSVLTLWRDGAAGNYGNALFAGFNAAVASWAIVAYIGIKNTILDTWRGLTDWMYVEHTPVPLRSQSKAEHEFDWRAVLYHGDDKHSMPLIEASLEPVVTTEEAQA